jgi:hypothetical protein
MQAKPEEKQRKNPVAPAGDTLQSINRAKAPASPLQEAPASKADRPPIEQDASRMARRPSPSPPQGESAADVPELRKEQPLAQGFTAPEPEKGRAREVFYGTPMPGKKAEKDLVAQDEPTRATRPGGPPPVTPLGLRYSILRGVAEEKSGESARLTVEANDTGYLYVLGQDAGGAWTVLFPGKETGAEAARVEKRRRYTIPPTGAFTFAEPSGDNRLLIVFSRQPRADLRGAPEAGLFADLRSDKKKAQIDDLAGRARKQAGTHALLTEEVEERTSTGSSEKAVYVVDPSPDPSSSIMVETIFPPR